MAWGVADALADRHAACGSEPPSLPAAQPMLADWYILPNPRQSCNTAHYPPMLMCLSRRAASSCSSSADSMSTVVVRVGARMATRSCGAGAEGA